MVSSILLSVVLFVYPVVLTLCVTASSNYALYFHNQLSATNIETSYKSRIHNTPAHWRQTPSVLVSHPKFLHPNWMESYTNQTVHLLFRNKLLSPSRNSPQLMSPESSLKGSGAEEVKVTGEGRKVHNDELYDLYPSLHAHGGAVVWCTALQAGRSRVRFPMVSLKFFIGIILPAKLWPWSWLGL